MVEGLAIIFVVFIIVMIVVFGKKEYGNLWVKLQIAMLVVSMLAAPIISILGLTGAADIPVESAWVFFLFTVIDIIVVVLYIRSKIYAWRKRKRLNSISKKRKQDR